MISIIEIVWFEVLFLLLFIDNELGMWWFPCNSKLKRRKFCVVRVCIQLIVQARETWVYVVIIVNVTDVDDVTKQLEWEPWEMSCGRPRAVFFPWWTTVKTILIIKEKRSILWTNQVNLLTLDYNDSQRKVEALESGCFFLGIIPRF